MSKPIFKKWHAEKPEGSNGFWYIDEEGRAVGEIVVYPCGTKAEAESKACLIAAAPELLATLQKVVEYHKYVQEKCIWNLEANAQVDLIQLLRDTEAAIANATKEG